MSSRIEKNHWFIDEHGMSISLMRFYVDIRISRNDNFIFYHLDVYSKGKIDLTFNFYSLEDAVTFTEQEIDKSIDKKDILKRYVRKFKDDEFKPMPKVKTIGTKRD